MLGLGLGYMFAGILVGGPRVGPVACGTLDLGHPRERSELSLFPSFLSHHPPARAPSIPTLPMHAWYPMRAPAVLILDGGPGVSCASVP